jgi:hypothetical protein
LHHHCDRSAGPPKLAKASPAEGWAEKFQKLIGKFQINWKINWKISGKSSNILGRVKIARTVVVWVLKDEDS